MLTLLKKYNNQDDGFTLIELLIVVLIIGILAAIAIPVYLGIQNQAHKATIKADVNVAVKQVQVALTEGQTVNSQAGTRTGSDGEAIVVAVASDGKNFTVSGYESRTDTVYGSTKKNVNYTYTYDSSTGNFTEDATTDPAVALSATNVNNKIVGATGGSSFGDGSFASFSIMLTGSSSNGYVQDAGTSGKATTAVYSEFAGQVPTGGQVQPYDTGANASGITLYDSSGNVLNYGIKRAIETFIYYQQGGEYYFQATVSLNGSTTGQVPNQAAIDKVAKVVLPNGNVFTK